MGETGHRAASWAFVGLHLLSRPMAAAASLETDRQERIILGAAQLLGFVIDKAARRDEALEERARRAESEVKQMKLIRAEDAKANEKVVSIFSSHEQSWVAERKRLTLQIRAIATQLQSLRSKNEENLSNLNYRIAEAECEIQAKDKALEQETAKGKELAYDLQSAKRAFAELVSSQSQLEAEMARALEQAETARQELDRVLETREEAVEMMDRLSDKLVKVQNDAEQKEKMLSALSRKSLLDAAEKQMLLKELKMSKAKNKQAELKLERWKDKRESSHKKGSRPWYSVEAGISQERIHDLQTNNLLLDYFESERESGGENVIAAIKCLNKYSNEDIGNEIASDDIQHLQDWVRLETQKYATILEQKHFTEIEAFSEQMRLKDERLEAFRWRLLSKDMESKRLLSRIESLEEKLSQLRDENSRLGTLVLDREEEITSLKDQFGFFVHHCQRNSCKLSPASSCKSQAEIDSGMRNDGGLERDVEVDSAGDAHPLTNSPLSSEHSVGNATICMDDIHEQAKSNSFVTNSPTQEIGEEKDVLLDPVHVPVLNSTNKDSNTVRTEPCWKMDIHALGVSYKIKRLKQQLVVLEKLSGMKQVMIRDDAQDSPDDRKADDNKQHLKGIVLVIHLLNKQVKRFQSLEEKTNDLCKRMHESDRRKEQSRLLENFLEETFQLQRIMVATGQKLAEVQAKIAGSIRSSDGVDGSAGFSMEQFADVIGSLFRDIQRGLEVRISRIIGDIEGTLACDGIRHM